MVWKTLRYPEFNELIKKYNIYIGLTETKTDDTDNIQLPGNVTYMKNRQKLTYIRSGGIILEVKDVIVQHVTIINTDAKYVVWFKSKNFC